MATLAMQKGNREYVGPQMELIQAESKNDQPQVSSVWEVILDFLS